MDEGEGRAFSDLDGGGFVTITVMKAADNYVYISIHDSKKSKSITLEGDTALRFAEAIKLAVK